MPTNFPGSLDTFTSKVGHVSPNAAADVNALQDAVVAIETTLKTTPNPNPLDYVSKTQPDTISGAKSGEFRDWGGGFYNVKSAANTGANGAAVGDGAADDTLALQAAINAAQSTTNWGVVWLPKGIYRITATLTWNLTVVIMGPGTIKAGNATNLAQMLTTFNVNAAGSMLVDVTIDGNSANNTSGGIGIDWEGPSDFLIYGVTIQNLLSFGMLLGADGRVDTCRATGIKGKAFASSGSSTGVRFHKVKVTASPTGGQQAVALSGTDSMLTESVLGPGLKSQAVQIAAGADRSIVADVQITTYDDGLQILANDCQVLAVRVIGDSINSGGGNGIVTLGNASFNLVMGSQVIGPNVGQSSLGGFGIGCDLVQAGTQRGNRYIGNTVRLCWHGFAVGGATGLARQLTFADNQSLDNSHYGFNLSAGNIDGVNVHDHTFNGNGSGPVLDNQTALNVTFRNCPGLNPSGTAIGPAFALPATTVDWVNNTRLDGTLYVTAAGTVTVVKVNGVTVNNPVVGGSYRVVSLGKINLTYTGAPTLVFVGE